jgi:acetolactate synthase-1/2/3 large subunit
VTGDTKAFAHRAKIVHIDVDASEHNKNKHVELPIVADAKQALSRLLVLQGELKTPAPDTAPMGAPSARRGRRSIRSPTTRARTSSRRRRSAPSTSSPRATPSSSPGVGQHQMWTAQFYDYDQPRRYISSLGLARWASATPAALARRWPGPTCMQVVDIDGDGSFMMNIQELATAAIEKIGAKVMILNNQHLGMVVQWEDRFNNSVRGNTILGDKANIGGPETSPALFPTS